MTKQYPSNEEGMRYVSMVKIRAADAPLIPPGDPTTYHYGEWCEGQSLPVAYEIEGWLLVPPVVGRRVEIIRCARNGISSLGIYRSTPVTLMDGDTFYTNNSVYRLVEKTN